jgi:hypothetical protein
MECHQRSPQVKCTAFLLVRDSSPSPHIVCCCKQGTKEFVDGSLGSHTALLWQPYSDMGPPAAATQPANGAALGQTQTQRCM